MKAWYDEEVHRKAVENFGKEIATRLEREAHHRGLQVGSVSGAYGHKIAVVGSALVKQYTLHYINGAWREAAV